MVTRPRPPARVLPWKVGQLRRVLVLGFGAGEGGKVDTRAVAAGFGVSQRSVQRWIAGRVTSWPNMSTNHQQLVATTFRPSAEALANESNELEYARSAIDALRKRRHRNALPAWRKQGFLEPHQVVILELPGGLRQVSSTKVNSRNFNEVRRRGRILEQIVVANKFEATVLTHELLRQVDGFRLAVPASVVRHGRTWVWLSEAKTSTLADSAVTEGVG